MSCKKSSDFAQIYSSAENSAENNRKNSAAVIGSSSTMSRFNSASAAFSSLSETMRPAFNITSPAGNAFSQSCFRNPETRRFASAMQTQANFTPPFTKMPAPHSCGAGRFLHFRFFHHDIHDRIAGRYHRKDEIVYIDFRIDERGDVLRQRGF